MTTELDVSLGSGKMVDVAKATVEKKVQYAIDEGRKRKMQRAAAEIAEPQEWWNVWALGPFQVTAPGGPLLPHKIIKVGQTFYVATVLWLSDIVLTPGGPTVCSLISNLACDFKLDYCTGDICAWTPAPAQLSPKGIEVNMVPNQCYYVDVQEFQAIAGMESCYEMHICAKITGCEDTGGAPALAGFASAVYDFDPDLFYPPPGGTPTFPLPGTPPGTPPGGATPAPGVPAGWRFREEIRFMIYT